MVNICSYLTCQSHDKVHFTVNKCTQIGFMLKSTPSMFEGQLIFPSLPVPLLL